jgi:hypothetical protein
MVRLLLSENSVRHIDTIKEMESLKYEYQIRCSHYELEFSSDDKRISCSICGKNWSFKEDRGYSKFKEIYKADIE